MTSISERLMTFTISVLKFVNNHQVVLYNYQINRQLLRCASSAGANYEESQASESRRDFIHKLMIVLKELRECKYWLTLIKNSNMLKSDNRDLNFILEESIELTKIIGKSIVTAKSKL